MSKQPRRFKIKGELVSIVNKIVQDRERFKKDCIALSDKYKFQELVLNKADYFSGEKLIAFANPNDDANLSIFRKPKKDGIYYPKVKEGKEVIKDIKNVKDWSLKEIWDYLEYQPHPFGANGGIYQESKAKSIVLFYTYDESFKGHSDLEELKLSEYYAMIGE